MARQKRRGNAGVPRAHATGYVPARTPRMVVYLLNSKAPNSQMLASLTAQKLKYTA